jgi:hypothetical protein
MPDGVARSSHEVLQRNSWGVTREISVSGPGVAAPPERRIAAAGD